MLPVTVIAASLHNLNRSLFGIYTAFTIARVFATITVNASSAYALSPFVNLGMQHDGRRAEPWMKKVTTFASLWESKRDLLESTKMDFMRLRNESKLTMLLVEISTESIYWSKYLSQSGCVGVSDVHVPSAYAGMQSSAAVLQ
jgi:hypothetical protein